MLSGPKPELVVTGQRLSALMMEAKLLSTEPMIEGLLAPAPLASLAK
jgi:hypothetical protein